MTKISKLNCHSCWSGDHRFQEEALNISWVLVYDENKNEKTFFLDLTVSEYRHCNPNTGIYTVKSKPLSSANSFAFQSLAHSLTSFLDHFLLTFTLLSPKTESFGIIRPSCLAFVCDSSVMLFKCPVWRLSEGPHSLLLEPGDVLRIHRLDRLPP